MGEAPFWGWGLPLYDWALIFCQNPIWVPGSHSIKASPWYYPVSRKSLQIEVGTQKLLAPTIVSNRKFLTRGCMINRVVMSTYYIDRSKVVVRERKSKAIA